MTVIETRVSVWEALAGRMPGTPVAPDDPGVWATVAERLNPARAKPRLRKDIETTQMVSVRNVPYAMLRSPDRQGACYLRLAPEELALAELMDGTRTVARLVAEFVRISGRLAPDQVTRVVADLAGNRMLDELPVDAFAPLGRVRRRPWAVRFGRGLLAAARGQRLVVARIDPLIGLLYRGGGRLLFNPVVAVLLGVVALCGLGFFGWTWTLGSQPVFLTGGSYAVGAAVLLGLNAFALACHELGHALATRHAGRRVPAAGFLVYFGIPSVFVDTTDVWMADRRARLVTTAAGPATGLVLAGVAQLVGLVHPPVAPLAFKLSFALYLNAAFNLNPFIALDGYYLLMDWLEVPNLRARALAWLAARLRRRPPRFGDLDGEGRLIAIYGMLTLIWLVIAVNLAYRIYLDRVRGLFTGLWHAGQPQRLLLVAVVAGLAAPLVSASAGWLGRRWRRWRTRLAERSVLADAPRRLDTMRHSAFGSLPAEVLTRLAADARWVRPRPGEQVVFAGTAHRSVYVVVDGALEGRRPGDPGGWVRERVDAGGVVGLAPALTGASSMLDWHAADATLLAVPPSTVASAVGSIAGPHPADRAELEYLLENTPALARTSAEGQLGLAASARPVTLPPGATLTLQGAEETAILVSGMLVRTDGAELRAGALIGPTGVPMAAPVARARTVVRAWNLPAVSGMKLLLGAAGSVPAVRAPGVAPAAGVHPPASYPPLAAPPGTPPPTVDDHRDRRFERRLWWLLILLLLFAVLLIGSDLVPGPAWGEMPDDHLLLHVDRGTATVTVDSGPVVLQPGVDRYVGRTDRISVAERGLARLTFRGGGFTFLCGGAQIGVGPLSSSGSPARPTGELSLIAGRLLADTTSTSRAFRPARLLVGVRGQRVANVEAARFAVEAGAVTVAAGLVTFDGTRLPAADGVLRCGTDDSAGAIPVPDTEPAPTDQPTTNPSPSQGQSPSASPGGSPVVSAGPTATGSATTNPIQSPTAGPTTGPTTGPPPPTTGAPAPTTGAPPPPPPPPGDATRPVFRIVRVREVSIGPPSCPAGTSSTVLTAGVSDAGNPPQQLTVSAVWSVGGLTRTISMSYKSADVWEGTVGPYTFNFPNVENPGTVTVTATDAAGNRTTSSTALFYYTDCPNG